MKRWEARPRKLCMKTSEGEKGEGKNLKGEGEKEEEKI